MSINILGIDISYESVVISCCVVEILLEKLPRLIVGEFNHDISSKPESNFLHFLLDLRLRPDSVGQQEIDCHVFLW